MRHHRLILLVAVVASSLAPAAWATVPTAMHFQGFLVATDGTLLDGLQNLDLTLYDAATGDNWVWTESQVVSVERGAFAVILGGVDPLDAVLFEDWPLWLAVTVNGTELSPRSLLGAVPYAARAAVCEDATGDIHPRSVTVAGVQVIDAQGNWVGPPATQDCNANHYLDGDGTCKRSPHACDAGEVLDGAGNCYIPMPIGTIVMWSGSTETIPTGWRLCDGAEGTPDLRGRFVVAAGEDPVNTTGGSNNVTLTVAQMPSHAHTASTAGSHTHTASEAGTHTHTMNSAGSHDHDVDQLTLYRMSGDSDGGVNRFDQGSGDIRQVIKWPPTGTTDWGGAHTHTIQSAGAHSHTIQAAGNHTHAIQSTGGSQPFDNRPAYYALAYIMRVSY